MNDRYIVVTASAYDRALHSETGAPAQLTLQSLALASEHAKNLALQRAEAAYVLKVTPVQLHHAVVQHRVEPV